MATEYPTIEAFRAARRFHPDATEAVDPGFMYRDDPDCPLYGRGPTWGKPKPVLEYDGLLIGVVTKYWPIPAMLEGQYHLQLSNGEWVTDDLEFLERMLWQWWCAECGYVPPTGLLEAQ